MPRLDEAGFFSQSNNVAARSRHFPPIANSLFILPSDGGDVLRPSRRGQAISDFSRRGSRAEIVGWAKRKRAHLPKHSQKGGHGAFAPLPTLRQRDHFWHFGHQ